MQLIKSLFLFCLSLIFVTVQTVRADDTSTRMTVDEFKKQNPNANIKVVTPDEMEKIKKEKEANAPVYDGCGRSIPRQSELSPSGSHVTPVVTPAPSGYYRDSSGDWWPYFRGGNFSSGSGDKETLIVLAVVGVIIVAALVIYSGYYLYKAAASGLDCKAYNEFALRYSYLQDSSSQQSRSGALYGASYSLGYDISFGTMGLTLEGGEHHLNFNVRNTAISRNYDGAYFLIGPSFEFPLGTSAHALALELLGGTSTNKDIGLMSTLKFGFNFGLSEHLRLGVHFGAGVIDIQDFDGYLSDSDQLSWLYGAQLGYRF